MNRKPKSVMVINSTNIDETKKSPLILTELTEHKKTTTYDVGYLSPCLGHAHKYVSGLNQLIGSQPSHLDNWISTLSS
jgi:hypothetical protein